MKKILLLEDDKFFATELEEMLRDRGAECVVVGDTETAVITPLDEVSAAVIDVMLPNDPGKSGISAEESRGGFMTGVAVARRLRKSAPNLPIILFSGGAGTDAAEKWAKENNAEFALKSDGFQSVISFLQRKGALGAVTSPRAFIVHGHDEQALLELKNFIQNSLKWQEPVIHREQPSGGKTIIDKFEELSGTVDYAFVLMTPDDKVVQPSLPNDEKRRSRQNVIFELGFFYAKLRRKSARVIVLHKGGLELPSDIHGIVWIDITNGIAAAGEDIRRELGL